MPCLNSSNPASNATLPTGPPQVELTFSEPVAPGLSTIKVLDSSGLQVDLQDVKVDPNNPARLTVSLRSLTDGVYTVTWKAVSAADGHLTGGTYPFAVGNVDAAALSAAKSASTTSLPFSAVASKWVFYLALALAGWQDDLHLAGLASLTASIDGGMGAWPVCPAFLAAINPNRVVRPFLIPGVGGALRSGPGSRDGADGSLVFPDG